MDGGDGRLSAGVAGAGGFDCNGPAMDTMVEHTLDRADARRGLRWRDVAALLILCALLYGWGAFAGAPLTMHEARLPQLAREMLHNGQWVLPLSGVRPWLERPPVPHWFTAASLAIFGRTGEWVVRLPAAMAGMILVLLTAWMAGRGFGRSVGLLSGAVMASSFEVYRYATLAEDDIYLAAVVAAAMACFVMAEFSSDADARPPATLLLPEFKNPIPCDGADADARPPTRFLGGRTGAVALFFLLLGAMNWIKGPAVGAVPVVAAMTVFLLWNGWDSLRTGPVDWRPIRRYLWLWGWIAFAALALLWPYLAWRRYPSILDNWMYDYRGQGEENFQFAKPFWHYFVQLPGLALLPWTPAVIWGLIATTRTAWRRARSFERFTWVWAVVSLVVLSIPGRKHHHYLLPTIAPWAMLGAIGLREFAKVLFNGKGPEWSRRPSFGLAAVGLPGVIALAIFAGEIPGPRGIVVALSVAWLACVALFYVGLSRKIGRGVMASILLGLIVGYGYAMTFIAGEGDRTAGDMAFLSRVPDEVPATAPLLVNAAVDTLDFFRVQYYLPDRARLLHNLTYLRDETIGAPTVYVVTRARDGSELGTLGAVRIVDQSAKSRRERDPGDRFTLFSLTFDKNLKRYPATRPIDVLQAMQRRPGPFLGR